MEEKKPSKREYKILAIYGSPRKGGNTSILMDRFLEGIMENPGRKHFEVKVEKIMVMELDISSCRECRNCSRTGECIVEDDMQDVFESLIDSDFIAVSSPVFFTTVSGYLKALIDRCQRFWALKYEHKKNIIKKDRQGIFISASGSGNATIFDCARKVIRALFDVLYIRYLRDFVYHGIDEKGDILKNSRALEQVYNFGRELKLTDK